MSENLKITLLCDNPESWIMPYLKDIKDELLKKGHYIRVIDSHKDLTEGDIAIFLSCEQVVPPEYLELNSHNLVVHESDLPKGKGWSPLTWQILEGKNKIPITLFEAEPEVDTGDIYLQDEIELDGTELLPEIKHKQGIKTKKLILKFIERYPDIQGEEQTGEETFYEKREPKDSELDIHKTIDEQFNLLRVVDNERYPAFFYKNGIKYILKIFKEENKNE